MSHHDDLYGEMEANGRGTGAPSRHQGDNADSDSVSAVHDRRSPLRIAGHIVTIFVTIGEEELR